MKAPNSPATRVPSIWDTLQTLASNNLMLLSTNEGKNAMLSVLPFFEIEGYIKPETGPFNITSSIAEVSL